jgi:glycosyltransferase involved in cell wall biosynthesis
MIQCSVAIPVYNGRDLVSRAVESALAQNISGLEIVVIDNCSTDGTWAVLERYRDPRLRRLRNDVNIGLFPNLNRCLQEARGAYLRILCCDDALIPGCLQQEVNLLDAHPNIVLLSTRGRLRDPSGHERGIFGTGFAPGTYPGEQAIVAALWLHAHYSANPFNYPSGILFRRGLALTAGGFSNDFRVAGDIDFFLRLLRHGDLAIVDQFGCDILVHDEQIGRQHAGTGVEIRELLHLAERHRSLMGDALFRRLSGQWAGIALGQMFRYGMHGAREARAAHWRIFRDTRVSLIRALASLTRAVAFRGLSRLGLRFCPVEPQPFNARAPISRLT